MTLSERFVWSLAAGLALAGLLLLAFTYGWVSGDGRTDAFGDWQLLMLIAAGGAFVTWYTNKDALAAGEAGSAASPALLLGTLALVSLPFYNLGFFAVLAIPALHYAYTNLSIVPIAPVARKAWAGAIFAVIALVIRTILCLTATWQILP